MQSLRNRFAEADGGCREVVAAMLARVRQEGDAAVVDYCRQFDAPTMSVAALRVTPAEFAQAEQEVDDDFRETLRFAAGRIRTFHERPVRLTLDPFQASGGRESSLAMP